MRGRPSNVGRRHARQTAALLSRGDRHGCVYLGDPGCRPSSAFRSGPSAKPADSPVTGSLDDDEGFREYTPSAPATMSPHAYSLAECLALADCNFPNLWAARARLALTHAQLDEVRTVPWSQWSASALFGVLPTLGNGHLSSGDAGDKEHR